MRPLLLLALLLGLSTPSPAASSARAPSASQLEALRKRAVQLAELDQTAADATDVLLSRPRDESRLGVFVARVQGDSREAVFGRLSEDRQRFTPAYAFRGPRSKRGPMVEVDVKSAPDLTTLARATRLALDSLGERRAGMNTLTLEEEGAITVLVMQGTQRRGEVVFGGDTRLRISKDGLKLLERQQLHRAVISVDTHALGDGQTSMHSHVLVEAPTDTDVVTVLQHPQVAPHLVASDSWLYRIEKDGRIHVLDRSLLAGAPPGSAEAAVAGLPACGAADLACLRKACDAGRRPDCLELAARYAQGRGVPRDPARAAELQFRGTAPAGPRCPTCESECAEPPTARCESLCMKEGQGTACTLLGQRELGRAGGSGEKAVGLLERACAANDPAGCGLLGMMSQLGRGVAKDPARSLELMHKACKADEPASCGTLGLLYVSGQGVVKDEPRGAQLLGRSCAQGYLHACATLGQVYENGAGVPADEPRAAELYEKACNGSDRSPPVHEACFTVADLYDHGVYLPKDKARARALYRKGCTPQTPKACERLQALEAELRAAGAK
jgi:TPR repeat protein